MTVVLGLLAAIFYGVGDFAGGLASRSRNAVTVLLHSYPVGALLMLAMLPLFPGRLSERVIVFGVAGGLAGCVGVILMYSLMAVAPMNVISPVSAVMAAVVPVIVSVVIGERPHATAWFGIALAIGAVVLVSRTTDQHPHGRIAPRVVALAVLSGLGFGLYFVFLARAGAHSGLWPLVVSRITSACAIVPLAATRRAVGVLRGRLLAIVVLAGATDASANLAFLIASRHGLLSLAAVLTALYPAVTVMLAVGVLHEHTSRAQRVGLGLAAGAIVLITV
ncbi:MAG: DMT family transporter [Actinomycetota bacterium]|nr:DMT family transporter [Actinomycetota bacterium]